MNKPTKTGGLKAKLEARNWPH